MPCVTTTFIREITNGSWQIWPNTVPVLAGRAKASWLAVCVTRSLTKMKRGTGASFAQIQNATMTAWNSSQISRGTVLGGKAL
jgi:hypothetical protein